MLADNQIEALFTRLRQQPDADSCEALLTEYLDINTTNAQREMMREIVRKDKGVNETLYGWRLNRQDSVPLHFVRLDLAQLSILDGYPDPREASIEIHWLLESYRPKPPIDVKSHIEAVARMSSPFMADLMLNDVVNMESWLKINASTSSPKESDAVFTETSNLRQEDRPPLSDGQIEAVFIRLRNQPDNEACEALLTLYLDANTTNALREIMRQMVSSDQVVKKNLYGWRPNSKDPDPVDFVRLDLAKFSILDGFPDPDEVSVEISRIFSGFGKGFLSQVAPHIEEIATMSSANLGSIMHRNIDNITMWITDKGVPDYNPSWMEPPQTPNRHAVSVSHNILSPYSTSSLNTPAIRPLILVLWAMLKAYRMVVVLAVLGIGLAVANRDAEVLGLVVLGLLVIGVVIIILQLYETRR